MTLLGTDPDYPAQTLTYGLVEGPEGLTVNEAGVVAWTPTEAQGPGTYAVSVKVTDGGSPALSATNAFEVTVTEVNAAPSLAKPADQNVNELVTMSLNLAGTDGDLPAQTLTYGLVDGPVGLTVSGAGVVAWTPTEAQGPGTYTVSVKVTDGGSPALSVTNAFVVTVNEVNTAPSLAKPADQNVNELATLTLNLSAVDGDLPAQTLTYGLVDGPVGLTVNGAGVVAWTPTEAQGPGTYTVTVKVTDSGSPTLSVTNAFVVTVNEVNVSPSLAKPADQNVDELVALSLNLVGTDGDLPAQTLTYGLVEGPAGLTVNGAGLVTWTPTEAQGPGAYTVSVKVTDSGSPGLSATNSFVVTVTEVNTAPNLAKPLDQTVDELVAMTLNLAGTDGDLPAQTLTYGLVDGPVGLTVSGAGAISWTPTEAQGPGTYTVSVKVTDSGSPALSATNAFVVTVNEVNVAPSLAKPADQNVSELAAMTLNLAGTDGDLPAQTLTYGLVDGPVGLTVGAGGAVSWTPTEAQGPGTYPVSVKVTDSGSPGLSTTNAFVVTVTEVNVAPSLAKPADQNVSELAAMTLNLAGTDGDLPAQTLTYGLVDGPVGLTVSGAGVVAWTPTEAQGPGTYTVSVKVADSGSPALSATNTFVVTVNEVNGVPNLAKPADRNVNEQTAMSLSLSATDADLPSQTLTYGLVSGPTGLTVSGAGVVNWTPTEAQGPGTYTASVKVTDNGSPALSATNSFVVTVNDFNVAPNLVKPADVTLNELGTLAMILTATDGDVPAQTLTYGLVSGPAGLAVSTTGMVNWSPTEAQGPGTYTVSVKVTDSGSPAQSTTNSFVATVNELPEGATRMVWQIGVDNDPAVPPYNPSGEFSVENRLNDPAPGSVTRVPGDSVYDANPGVNPGADDDYYFNGTYAAGFNGLTGTLVVPYDEPAIAWERANTQRDMTNRVHFVLTGAQVAVGASFRLSLEFCTGGYSLLGVTQSGFGTNDMVIRYRNGAGVVRELFTQRVMARTNVVLEFSAATVGATVGANTVEIVRTGPAVVNYSYWIQTDYLRLESLAAVPPAVTTSVRQPKRALATTTAREKTPPMMVSAGNSSSGGSPSAGEVALYGTRMEAGSTYLILTHGQPEAGSSGLRFVVEGSSDGVHWSESTVIEESRVEASGWITITDRDLIPINQVPSRRLRLRPVFLEESDSPDLLVLPGLAQ